MLVQVNEMPDDSVLQNLRVKFQRDLNLTKQDFYSDGALIKVADEDFSFMPTRNGKWLNVNFWKSFYGLGYERGDFGLFVRCAEWLEENLTDCKVFYGHDVDDENVKLFDLVERGKYLAYFEKVGNEPYATKEAKRKKQLQAKWREE